MSETHLRIGLTGSIGMGKSTVLRFFRDAGLETWDADAAVQRLYAPDGQGTAEIAKIAPDCTGPGGVDKTCLTSAIASDASLLQKIEAAIHPLVAEDREAFAQRVTTWAAVYDIPLLFETHAADAYKVIIVVSAPAEIQRTRVLARPGMTEDKFRLILSRQIPDAQKRSRADYILDTSKSIDATQTDVHALVKNLKDDYA